MASTSEDTPQSKRLCLGNRVEVIAKKGYTIIQIPDQFVEPISQLMTSLSNRLLAKTPIDDLETDSLMEFVQDEAINDEYETFRNHLDNNLDKFDRKSLTTNLPNEDFESFKSIRKQLTRMVKIDEAAKYKPASTDNINLVKTQVNISPLINDKEIRNKCYNMIDSAKHKTNGIAVRHLANELTKTYKLVENDFNSISNDRQRLVWAKAYRAAKRGLKFNRYENSTTGKTEKKKKMNRHVSFSSNNTDATTTSTSTDTDSDSDRYTWIRKRRKSEHQTTDAESSEGRHHNHSPKQSTSKKQKQYKRKKPGHHPRN